MDSRNKKADTRRVNRFRRVNFVLLTFLLAGAGAADLSGPEARQAEMSSQNSAFTLKVERNEVPVRMGVRDAQGRPILNLTKDDFRILDNGKPQVITHFSTQGVEAAPSPAGAALAAGTQTALTAKVAERFVALYFDDLVMGFDGIVRTRDAASRYLRTSVQPTDRVAIFTSSGKDQLDFTNDRDKLEEALARGVAVNSFFLLFGSIFIGSHVLEFFGISLPVVRIAGGLVVTRCRVCASNRSSTAPWSP